MNPQLTLAIETSSRLGSVALGNGSGIIAQGEFSTQTAHGGDLLPTIDGICRNAAVRPNEITLCCLSIGPGSFTGLRIGVTFVRSLALAHGTDIVAVPSLNVIAANCENLDHPPARVAVILDAKRDQVFAAQFEHTPRGYESSIPARLTTARDILSHSGRPDAVTGEGIEYHRAAVKASGVPMIAAELWRPRAEAVFRLGTAMATLGQFTNPRELIPLYIRRPEAEEIWEARHNG